MKDQIKTVGTVIDTLTDIETGEIIDTSVKVIKVVVDPEDFCLVYAGFWNVLLESPLSKSDLEMFAYLIGNYSDGTPFTISGFTKQQIAAKSNKAPSSYDKSTSVLLKNNLIYAVQSKVYRINPRYAFQGSSKNRHKAVIEMIEVCKDC
jgi:hypothetical protein